jgi:uncharacterized membrane protein
MIMILKYFAILWAVWWFGLVLICLRDDNEQTLKELYDFINYKGVYGIFSAIIILFFVPLSIPYSISNILKQWMRKK